MNEVSESRVERVNVCVFERQQRDSGDDEDMDKNSEDEEGQLEEQIERLQEKVESAQSEQKNLFLVIFQVTDGSNITALFCRYGTTVNLQMCFFLLSAFHHVVDGASGSL